MPRRIDFMLGRLSVLEQLVARAGTPWDARMAAVANGLEPTTRLHGNQPIKVARAEPYRPR